MIAAHIWKTPYPSMHLYAKLQLALVIRDPNPQKPTEPAYTVQIPALHTFTAKNEETDIHNSCFSYFLPVLMCDDKLCAVNK